MTYYKIFDMIYEVPNDWYKMSLGHKRIRAYDTNIGLWKRSTLSIIDIMELSSCIKLSRDEAFVEII